MRHSKAWREMKFVLTEPTKHTIDTDPWHGVVSDLLPKDEEWNLLIPIYSGHIQFLNFLNISLIIQKNVKYKYI